MSTNLTDASRVRRQEHPLMEPMGDDLVMLDVPAGKYFHLNPVAAHVWGLLDDWRAVDELRGAVTARFEVDDVTAGRDLQAFLRELLERGLIVVEGG